MSEPCCMEMCKSPSRTLCHCCKKNFCRNHFLGHDGLPNLELNSLVEEITLLNNRFTAFNGNKLIVDCHQNLEQIRTNCHKMIDEFFALKFQEINERVNEKVNQRRIEIYQMRFALAELFRKKETTMKDISSLKAILKTVEDKINVMEQTSFEIVVRPFKLTNDLIRIDELYLPKLDLSLLSSPYKTINFVSSSSEAIASNDRYFLIHQEPDLCLMDRELAVISRSQWNHGAIYDMCWSSILAHFFILTGQDLFIMNENTMAIKPAEIDKKRQWCSCTSSDTTLYLSTLNNGSSILQFHLFPSIQFEKEWKSHEICAQGQLIISIVYYNATIAMTLIDAFKEEKLIELRSSTNLERLWSLKLDIKYGTHLFRCSLFYHGHCLVWDYDALCLLHITRDGKLETKVQCNENPMGVISFNTDRVALLTMKGISLYKIAS